MIGPSRDNLPRDWSCNLIIKALLSKKDEWLALFLKEHFKFPSIVFKVPLSSLQYSKNTIIIVTRPISITLCTMEAQLCTLHQDEQLTKFIRLKDKRNPQPTTESKNLHFLYGKSKRVRVFLTPKKKWCSKHLVLFYYKPMVDLIFDSK